MGMFDTFYHEEARICCPNCNEELDLKNGLQSKHFENLLFDYFPGDVVEGVLDDDTFISDFEICDVCDASINYIFCFKTRIFVGIYQNVEEASKALEQFDVMEHYRKLYHEKNKFEQKYLSMRRKLLSTIRIHGEKPEKNTFTPLLNLHNTFIDYDIIKTLKNILNQCGDD